MMSRGREAVRVRVQKYEAKHPGEIRRFSVDPQITSLDELRNILVTAFDIKDDFSLSYKSIDDFGKDEFLILLSEWDLDAAFLRAYNSSSSPGSEPSIYLRIDIKSTNMANSFIAKKQDNVSEKHQVRNQNCNSENSENIDLKNVQKGLQGMLINQMEKTISLFSRALNLSEDPDAPIRPPLNQAEFHSFLGPVGHVVYGDKLREVIYKSGVDPSFRKVVWKHILNVYPEGMSGKERLDYMKKKSAEYYALRDVWRDCVNKGQISGTLAYVTNMVRKDVLRTDRHHKYYAGNDDNQSITFLFNILTTYALNHPTVSYCQGMSDIASPLLVVMDNEAHAYICLCSIMTRLYPNFLLDGEAMTLKFAHLTESLQIYDPTFYSYLQSQQADDLLFCYRWLLLEMKREFAFEDALHMLEVLWSSLPPNPPTEELSLKDKEFCPDSTEENFDEPPISPLLKTPRENAYTKLCAIRRQSSLYSLTSSTKGKVTYKRMNQSLDENVGISNNSSLKISKEFQSLDETLMNIIEISDRNSDPSTDIDIPVKNMDSYEKSNGNYVDLKYHRTRNNDLLRTAVNNKHFSSLDIKDQNVLEDICENTSKKLIKDFSEFKNISLKKKVISEYSGCDQNEQDGKIFPEESQNMTSQDDASLHQSDDSSSITVSSETNSHNTTDQLSNVSSPNNNVLDENLKETSLTKVTNVNGEMSSKVNGNKTDTRINGEIHEGEKKYDDVFIWENPLHSKCFEIKSETFQNLYKNPCDNFEKRENVQNCQVENSLVLDNCTNLQQNEKLHTTPENEEGKLKTLSRDSSKSNSKFFSNMSLELENARKNCEILLSNKKCTNFQSIASTITNFQKKCDFQSQSAANQNNHIFSVTNSCEEISESNPNKTLNLLLPSSDVFGGGNPFLIFLCLTLLMQHRDVIMRNQMDYNELAMYFDKMVRKHNVNRVLNQARRMYSCYMKEQRGKVNS